MLRMGHSSNLLGRAVGCTAGQDVRFSPYSNAWGVHAGKAISSLSHVVVDRVRSFPSLKSLPLTPGGVLCHPTPTQQQGGHIVKGNGGL